MAETAEISPELLDEDAEMKYRVTIGITGEPESYDAWHDGETFSEARDEAISRCEEWIRCLRKLRARDAR